MRVFLSKKFLSLLKREREKKEFRKLLRLLRKGAISLWSYDSNGYQLPNFHGVGFKKESGLKFDLSIKRKIQKEALSPFILKEFERRKIPLFTTERENDYLFEEIKDAVERVIMSGKFILGKEVERFEEELCEFLNVHFAAGVNSGTDGIEIVLRGISEDSPFGVITTPFTFFATVEAVFHAGAVPVFADIDPLTFNLSPESVEEYLRERCEFKKKFPRDKKTGIPIRAILSVDLYGQPCDAEKFLQIARNFNLFFLQDCAQSFGSLLKFYEKTLASGTAGDAGIFSFYPSKPLGGMGDGGAVVTNNKKIAEFVRHYRDHCRNSSALHTSIGKNSRLDEIQASVLRAKLKHYERFSKMRVDNAERYMKEIKSRCSNFVIIPEIPPYVVRHAWHLFTVKVEAEMRTLILKLMEKENIECRVYYPYIIPHLLKGMKEKKFILHNVKNAEKISESVFSIPFGAMISMEEQEKVVKALEKIGEIR